jgi:hypothetical protein
MNIETEKIAPSGRPASDTLPEEQGGRPKQFPSDTSYHAIPWLVFKGLTQLDAEGNPLLLDADIVTFGLLKCHAFMKGWCNPSLQRLANLSGKSVSSVGRSLQRLDAAGHIQRKTHSKGKIFLLTDVTAKGEVVQRHRIEFGRTKVADQKPVNKESMDGLGVLPQGQMDETDYLF